MDIKVGFGFWILGFGYGKLNGGGADIGKRRGGKTGVPPPRDTSAGPICLKGLAYFPWILPSTFRTPYWPLRMSSQ
jgi:hypothetical protein